MHYTCYNMHHGDNRNSTLLTTTCYLTCTCMPVLCNNMLMTLGLFSRNFYLSCSEPGLLFRPSSIPQTGSRSFTSFLTLLDTISPGLRNVCCPFTTSTMRGTRIELNHSRQSCLQTDKQIVCSDRDKPE